MNALKIDDGRLHACAARAAEAWGGLRAPPRLVCHRENAVFDVTLADGRRAALRLHRPGYQPPEAIRSEMLWCESLADAAFACPWPLRTEAGDLLHLAGDGMPVASLLLWIDAEPIGGTDRPFAGAAEDQAALYRELGMLIADLHLTSDAVAPPGLARPVWDGEALCSADAPLWGRYWENPALAPAEAGLLCAARDAARARLAERGAAGMGLIHADLLQENLLRAADDQLYVIDFDDGGQGYRPYDLATALVQHLGHPAFDRLRDALLDGYAEGGAALSPADIADLPMFVMLRAMASAGWIVSRAAPDDPRQRQYAERALASARAFLCG